MSYTQFVATATCTVVDGFNLESYLDAISERCVKEQNFIFEEYGEENGKIDEDFGIYVRQNGDKILIECDTEESNNNSGVWDWLVDQFVPVMTSSVMEIKSATIDSRSGVDCWQTYALKDGTVIGSDEIANIIEQYVKMSS